MAERTECPDCHGAGRCRHYRGTGVLSYPGCGELKHYTQPCNYHFKSGICRRCGGAVESERYR